MADRQGEVSDPPGLGPEVRRVAPVVMAGGLVAGLDITIVTVAIESLSRHLHSSVTSTQWVITAYLLAVGVTIPLIGWGSRRFGTRTLFIGALATFSAGSVLCGLAWSMSSLIAFRALQGLGGGLLGPVGQLILTRVAGPRRLGRMLGLFAAPAILAPVAGPAVGGLILEHLSWRWIFFINLPVGSVALLLALRRLPCTDPGPADPLDLRGFALAMVGIVGLTYALTLLAGSGNHEVSLATLTLSVAALALFARRALRQRAPLLDLRLLSSPGFAVAVGAFCILSAAVFANMLLLPLYFQTVHGTAPAATGLLMGSQSVALGLSMALSGRLVDRLGGASVALGGIAVMTAGTVCFVFTGPRTSYWTLVGYLVLRGLGVGAALMPLTAAAYGALRSPDLADGASLLAIGQRIAGSLGTALVAIVLAHALHADGSRAAAFNSTYRWTTLLTASALVPAGALVALGRRRRRDAAACAGVSRDDNSQTLDQSQGWGAVDPP